MTPEQIDLEFMHILIDQQEKDGNKQVYTDDEYEDYDKETDDYDDRISDMPSISSNYSEVGQQAMVRTQNEDDWEDVETDDF